MRQVVALVAAVVCALLAAPVALADRDADGSLRGTTAYHVEFALPGDGWGQGWSPLDGTPMPGLYIQPRTLADGSNCPLHVWVNTDLVAMYPVVGKKRVILRPVPFFRIAFDITHSGRHGLVRWWSGTDGNSPVIGAVQPAPPDLRDARRRWVITYARIESTAIACRRYANRKRPVIARTIGRTLRLAGGPAVVAPPYVAFVP